MSLIDKVLLLSHPEFHQKNFSYLINILRKNNYPLDMIFSCIKKRLSIKFQQIKNQKTSHSQEKIKENNFVVPYINNIADKFIKRFKNISNFKLSFYGTINKLNKFIKVHKDPLLILSHLNVVYKVNCLHCDASYVEQIRRLLKNRIDEHRNHIKRNTIQTSVLTEHRLQHSHEFD